MNQKAEIEDIECIINKWVQKQIIDELPIPDFWDECATTEELAEYLWENGFRKIK